MAAERAGPDRLDLARFRDPNDNFMDEVHGLRTSYGADVMSLILSKAEHCGYAYVMTNRSPSFGSSAFNVTGQMLFR